jgi:hypothetical protein
VSARYALLGAGFWSPEQPSLQAYLEGSRGEPKLRPDAHCLPARMRGRASLLTAMFADVFDQATRAASVTRDTLPMVFGSAYGEMGTTLALLEQLHGADGRLSPAKFQASVHNTAAGQLSIALGNRRWNSAIAAGRATVAMAIVEACAYLAQTPGAVLLACGDEGAVELLDPSASYGPLALAIVLANDGDSLRPLAWVMPRLLPLAELEPADALEPSVSENPCAPGCALLAAIGAQRCARVLLPGGGESVLALEVLPP